jgi:hypothetical protein
LRGEQVIIAQQAATATTILNPETLTLVLTCVQALRRGHYELWKDSMTGIRLDQLDPALRPRPRRRRKKSEEGGSEQPAA